MFNMGPGGRNLPVWCIEERERIEQLARAFLIAVHVPPDQRDDDRTLTPDGYDASWWTDLIEHAWEGRYDPVTSASLTGLMEPNELYAGREALAICLVRCRSKRQF